MNGVVQYFPLAGRILMGGMFLFFGVQKLLGFSGTAAFIASVGYSGTVATLATVVAVLVEVGAATLLIVGYKTRIAAAAMVLFTIAATLMFHLTWTENPINVVLFAKNVAILGGLFSFIAFGAGKVSFDEHERETPPISAASQV